MKKKLLQTALTILMLIMAMVARAGDVVALWDFKTMASGAVAIQGTPGTVLSNVDGIVLEVDATQGKLQSRGSDAQFNAGTIIRVPVKSAKDSVIVTSYPGYHKYTVGGTAAADDVTVNGF